MCDSCGKLAKRLTRDAYTKVASISGFSLDECSPCAKKRRLREVKEQKIALAKQAAEKRKFAAWLKKHKMTEEQLRALLPADFFGEEDD
jgi:hypothetical protein